MRLFTGCLRLLRVRAAALAVLSGLCLLAPALVPTAASAYSVQPPTGPWGPVGLPQPVPGAGLRAAPVSRARVSSALRRATGYSLSQVATQNACSRPAPERASCLAKLLVVAGTHRPISPRAGSSSGSLVQLQGQFTPMSEPAAISPPQLGTPAYLQQAYDLSYLSATKGGTDTIAVVDAYDDPTAEADLTHFRSSYGLPQCTSSNGCFTEVNQSGNSSPLPSTTSLDSWGVEASLDLDAISTVCPNCHILFVETNSDSLTDLEAGVSAAASLGANQISMSFGGPSMYAPSGTWTHAGVSSFASAGDGGYVGGGYGMFPASSPGVTAVGGTSLTTGADARGFAESAWSGGGSGCASTVTKPSWQTDSGCAGRAFTDVSADGDPATGLGIYDSSDSFPGWTLVGGTSLSAPLTAAYAALTGVDSAGTSQWAYTDSAELNDIVSGSNGSCGTYICDAGMGYDGPTGNGSISGDVISGGPVVAGTYASGLSSDWTSVTLSGGIYPNGNDTKYYWEYGTTSAYGQQTTQQDAGSGSSLVSVATPITGLTPGTTYHFRLVAANADATIYGYDETLNTFTPPRATVRPSVSADGGKFQDGATLVASKGTWNPSGTATLAWRICSGISGTGSGASGTGCSPISGASGGTYTTTNADIGHYIVFAVKETSSYGSTTAVSAPVGPIAALKPVVLASPRLAVSGRLLKLAGGSYEHGSVKAVRIYRCSRTCRWIDTTTDGTYRPRPADQGRYIRARAKVMGPGGSSWTQLTKPVLVLSASAGKTVVRVGGRSRRVIRGTNGHWLARMRAVTRHGHQLRFTVHSVRHRPILVWACVVRHGYALSCTRQHRLRSSATFTIRSVRGYRVQLIVVRRRVHAHLRRARFRRA